MRELLMLAVLTSAFGGLAANLTPQADFEVMSNEPLINSHEFVLQAGAVDCQVWRGTSNSDGSAPLMFDKSCSDALPAMAEAKLWRSGPDGLVVFADAKGSPIVEFAPADGDGLETFKQGVAPAFLRERR